jgi:hypothetical protein
MSDFIAANPGCDGEFVSAVCHLGSSKYDISKLAPGREFFRRNGPQAIFNLSLKVLGRIEFRRHMEGTDFIKKRLFVPFSTFSFESPHRDA